MSFVAMPVGRAGVIPFTAEAKPPDPTKVGEAASVN